MWNAEIFPIDFSPVIQLFLNPYSQTFQHGSRDGKCPSWLSELTIITF